MWPLGLDSIVLKKVHSIVNIIDEWNLIDDLIEIFQENKVFRFIGTAIIIINFHISFEDFYHELQDWFEKFN